MKTAQLTFEQNEIKQLDTLSGVVIVLFIFAFILLYTVPFIESLPAGMPTFPPAVNAFSTNSH